MLVSMVNLFFDKKKNALLIPIWRDIDAGYGVSSVKYSALTAPYTEHELGIEIEKALDISKVNEQEDKNQVVYKIAGNVKSWSAFRKKYESVSIEIDSDNEWTISKKRKQKDGAYGLDKDDLAKYQRTYTEPLLAEQLGKIVLEMLALK